MIAKYQGDQSGASSAQPQVQPHHECYREQPEHDEVHLLHPATWPGLERADHLRDRVVLLKPEQPLHEEGHREQDRADDPRDGSCGDHGATFQTVLGSFIYLLHSHSMFSFLSPCIWRLSSRTTFVTTRTKYELVRVAGRCHT